MVQPLHLHFDRLFSSHGILIYNAKTQHHKEIIKMNQLHTELKHTVITLRNIPFQTWTHLR